ncbi:hypothetical protein A2853_03660 [Candidatus Kaiserbacteria bacterium RIFCSPHIGHO2_01_FULL_55_17]|uniref:Uncharacterized protein n=1 Tax=Candidatus Kaiserbacteria bacterium RIFCSPHIGHO2_01_FULL_55_17 TaxID=1798484 RepID=A0A1F6D7L1_9BACT|nr:MAG: hypothetical protein A2853_03660 [Candidatus Kaiserbacteria bacterium RIFCSPHIGHO2_01_FULL_55_17]
MGFFSKYKTYLFIAGGALIAIGVWWGFSAETPSDSLLTTERVEGGPADKALVDTLLQLRSVTLSGTIFSDPAFILLQDFGTQIIPEPIGRPNPFAPLGVSATSSTVGNKLFTPRR